MDGPASGGCRTSIQLTQGGQAEKKRENEVSPVFDQGWLFGGVRHRKKENISLTRGKAWDLALSLIDAKRV